MERLDPRVIALWRLQGLVRVVLFWTPVSIGAGFALGLQLGSSMGFATAGLVVALAGTLAVLWPTLSWRTFGYEVRDHDLLVTQGVLFRHTVSIPLTRIQHVDTRQGPMERLYGLSQLVVYTAAGMSADGSLPGLDEARANHLRDVLVQRGGDDGV